MPPRLRFAPQPLTFLSAILLVLAFPPWDLSWLIWFALIPWFLALERTRHWKEAAMQGVWLSFFMSVFGFYWVAWVLHEFGALPWPMAFIGMLLFSFICQPQFPFAAVAWVWTARRRDDPKLPRRWLVASFVAFAVAYSGFDGVIPKLFTDTLGNSLYGWPHLRQAADLGGVHLITAPIFLFNDALGWLLTRLRRRSEPSLWPTLARSWPLIAVTGLMLVAFYAYGRSALERVTRETEQPLAHYTGAAIQGNIGDFDKLAAENGVRGAADRVVTTFIGMSEQALALEGPTDFLVWPETAYPSTFRTPQTSDELARDQRVEAFVRARGVPLLFGGYDHLQNKDYNALFLLSPATPAGLATNSDQQTYRKNILLLFGEYIPGAETFPWIKKAFPQVGNFGRGVGPEVLTVAGKRPLKLGPIICYEALFPNYVIGAANQGSELILNITNDSWFGPYGEPYLHLALSVFRSIETRLPQLRATNTGFSALITAQGDILQRTPLSEPTILKTRFPVTRPIPTLIKRWGNWYPLTAWCLGSIALAAIFWRRRAPGSPSRKPSRAGRASKR